MHRRLTAAIAAIAFVSLCAAGVTSAQSPDFFQGPLPHSYPGQGSYAPHYAPLQCDLHTRFCYRRF